MTTSESYRENTARDKILKRKGLFLKIHPYRNGDPDRLLLVPGNPGQAVFIEMKRDLELPRKLQRYRHNELRSLGFEVYVCYEYSRVIEIFEDVKARIEKEQGNNISKEKEFKSKNKTKVKCKGSKKIK